MLEKAAKIIKESSSIVALTGAGVSTAAGIPDFRSPESGLWKDPSKMVLFTAFGFALDPKGFYELGRQLLPSFLKAEPTLAHYFLAKLEHQGKLRCVITQNIDGLHQKAGSKKVIEMHGNLRTGRCTNCPTEYTLEEMADKMNQGHELPPTCQDCQSPIRPNIVLFGEDLPTGAYEEAMENLEDCDLLLVMGSSLVVYPVADMPRVVLRRHARLIIINLQPTQYDSSADVSLHMSLEEASRRLVEALGIKP